MTTEDHTYIPQGPKTLLLGTTGSGKTFSVRSLPEINITPFIIFTEPGMRTVADIGCDKLHYHYIKPAATSWEAMRKSAEMINRMDLKSLSGLTDINKGKHTQFLELLTTCNNFVCDRCGKAFGDVATWSTDRHLIIDSLSGLNIMAMDLVVGSKPVKSMADWGIAMDNLERVLNTICFSTVCGFTLIGHLERETDEVLGGVKLMASILGRKLAPRLPRFFDDVVMAENKAGKFSWTTISNQADLKNRNLPLAQDIPPSFKSIYDSWLKAGGKIVPTAEAAANA